MKSWKGRQWSWDHMDGLSLHNYTVVRFPASYKSVGFGEKEYAEILQATLEMDGLVKQHAAIMDKYDPEKKVALVVDEWGAWYAQLPGTVPGFLAQQNSIRDAIIAIVVTTGAAYLAWRLYVLAGRFSGFGDTTATSRIPIAPFAYGGALSMALCAVAAIMLAIEALISPSKDRPK